MKMLLPAKLRTYELEKLICEECESKGVQVEVETANKTAMIWSPGSVVIRFKKNGYESSYLYNDDLATQLKVGAEDAFVMFFRSILEHFLSELEKRMAVIRCEPVIPEDIFTRYKSKHDYEYDKVIFNDPATIVLWKDGTKTIVKCGENDTYDKEKGLALCFMKKALGNKSRNLNDILHKEVE